MDFLNKKYEILAIQKINANEYLKTADERERIKLSGNAKKRDEKLLLKKLNNKLKYWKNRRIEESKNLNYYTKIGHNFQQINFQNFKFMKISYQLFL